ncbi:hypothetical protein BDS110ZK14_55900 [Bradyrhizobium diazoefficiens]|nr:hypothetical protein XF15B_59670 [Bradyrhizobium diazoefficiens]
MTRLSVVAAVLIAAAVYQTQAAAARDAAPLRAATHVTTDCVRAPAVGAYASDGLRQGSGGGRLCLCALQATALPAQYDDDELTITADEAGLVESASPASRHPWRPSRRRYFRSA